MCCSLIKLFILLLDSAKNKECCLMINVIKFLQIVLKSQDRRTSHIDLEKYCY